MRKLLNVFFGNNTQKENVKHTEKVGNSQKTTAKAYNQVHKPNKYTEAINATNDSRMYDEAEHALREKSYAEQIKIWYFGVKGLRWLYPIISWLLANFAIWIYLNQATNGTGLGFWTFLVLLIASATLIETGKSHFSDLYFTENQQKAIFGTAVFTAISIALSSYGMYELTLKETDNSTEISADYQNVTDSTRQIYLEQIADLNATIEANRKSLGDNSKWVRLSASENMENAQRQKSELLALTKSETENLVKEKETALQTDFAKNNQNALCLAFIIFGVEILYILSIREIAKIRRNLKTENQTFNKIQVHQSVQIESPKQEPSLQEYFEMFQGLQNAQIIPIQNQKTGSKFGFQFSKNSSNNAKNSENSEIQKQSLNDTRNSTRNSTRGDGNRECLECGELFTYKVWNHVYCSEKCRVSAWEKRTGKTFKKRRK